MGFTAGTGNRGARQAGVRKADLRPTHDQLYLMGRINEGAPKGRLTPAAIQRLNLRYGTAMVLSSLRLLRGFPPEKLGRVYPYLERMCRG